MHLEYSYRIKITRLRNGERFALLIDKRTGLPIAETTRFSGEFRRTKNGSVSTMAHELRAIAIAMAWAEARGIDLDERIGSSKLLAPHEVMSLTDALRLDQRPASTRWTDGLVGSMTHYSRCLYVRDYLTWRAQRVNFRINDPQRTQVANDRLEAFRTSFDAILPRPQQIGREGVSHEVQARFLEVIHPAHPDNPFQAAQRARNYALLLLYYELGIRLSEALVIKGADLNLSSAPAVTIHRRADDPTDPRVDPPLTKTRGRILPIGETLRAALDDLIMNHRRGRAAKRTPYVFVSRTGQPISRRMVSNIMERLRDCFPDLPPQFTMHVLRHTWNDRFSELADELNMPESEEKGLRREAMGWGKNSEAAEDYTRHHTKKKADVAILELQNKSLAGRNR